LRPLRHPVLLARPGDDRDLLVEAGLAADRRDAQRACRLHRLARHPRRHPAHDPAGRDPRPGADPDLLPDHPRQRAATAAGGLRHHLPRDGHAAATGVPALRAPQRPAADGHGLRSRARVRLHRCGTGRDRLRLARHRPSHARCSLAARLPAVAGRLPRPRDRGLHRGPPDGYRLRAARPAHQVALTMAQSLVTEAAAPIAAPRRPTRIRAFWQPFVESRMGPIGLGTLILVALAAIFAPVISPEGPFALGGPRLAAPGTDGHILGTDHLGRDILAQIVYGARVSLTIGLVAA